MSSENYPLRQSGIYRNLPSFDPSLKGLKAIVVGATGISGWNTIRALLDQPERWSTIYALSRSAPTEDMLSLVTPEQQSHIKHVSIDLTGSAEKIASSLEEANVEAEYVFFYGYVHPKGLPAMVPKTAEKLVETNVPIFKNFVQALPLANIKPKRFLLQTGGKNYGGQLGRARRPYVESDPQPKHLAPNFYYPQEEALFKYCEENPGCSWNVIRPFGIIGAVTNAGMNTFLPYAVFAAVQAQKKEPIYFSGDMEEWQYEMPHSTARMSGYLSEWAVLEDKCKNQAFNAQDGNPLTWDRFFEELARWYGVEKGAKGPEEDESKFETIELAGGKDSPMGYGPPTEIRLSRTLEQWSKDPANHAVWKSIMEKSNGKVTNDVFETGIDVFMADWAVYKMGHPSVGKVRRFGFTGFVDTLESIFEMYQEMAKMGILPAPVVDAANPLV